VSIFPKNEPRLEIGNREVIGIRDRLAKEAKAEGFEKLIMEKNLLIENCKKLLFQTSDVESILNYLRSNGCSKTQSIVMLKSIKDISLDESKQIVHFSKTWQDTLDNDEKFQAIIEEILTKDCIS
jgi:hypothetical protein